MPADITGINVFRLKEQAFTLVKGPVFTTFLLADEINRSPAKTQSALLQAMQERAVTIDRETHRLSPHFTVFATQNPVEYQGTYPLPEAQKDRFMLQIPMGPPDRDGELELARRTLGADAPEDLLERGEVRPLIQAETLSAAKNALRAVRIVDELSAYGVDLVRRTRDHDQVLVGAGPRGVQSLLLAARALAVIRGRDFVTPDDIKEMALPVLGHRLVLRPEYEVEGLEVGEVIRSILEEIPVPR
jgi:MoxR-like ATPase